MTQEEKAKRYDEAIKLAKDSYSYPSYPGFIRADVVFPELKESEDEKIRKVLVGWFKSYKEEDTCGSEMFNGIPTDNILTWLEKQGQVKESSISQHENKTCKENSNSLTGKDEQKPADKTEPKFKIGDWITNGEYTWKVTDIKSLDYILQSQDGNIVDDTISFVDYNYFRLWSINDAKPGDVLVDIYNNIGIFQKCEGIYWQSCLYLGCNGELLGFSDGGCHKQTKTHPATKEQRDALEKAMTDAGYTFDFKKKELKKIENEIEIPFGTKDSELQEATYFIPKGFHAEIDDDKVVIKKGEKPAWREEDEQIILSIEQVMNCASFLNIVPEKIDKIKSWLKSLKPRICK